MLSLWVVLVASEPGQVMLDVAPHWQHVERGRAVQVAMPMPVAIDVAEVVARDVQPGQDVWRLSLTSPGAVFMSAKFSEFIVPEGVEVGFVARDRVFEAWFSSDDQTATGRFGSPMIPGDELMIEVIVPVGAAEPELVIESVSHGFRDVMGMGWFAGNLTRAAEQDMGRLGRLPVAAAEPDTGRLGRSPVAAAEPDTGKLGSLPMAPFESDIGELGRLPTAELGTGKLGRSPVATAELDTGKLGSLPMAPLGSGTGKLGSLPMAPLELGTGRLGSLPMALGSNVAMAGDPFECQRDIVCAEGQPYLRLKDAAAEGYDGVFVCSGQLVNNVRQDGRSLYLTAAHCEWWVDPSTMVYYWDYANQTCGGDDYPAFTFSTGSTDLYHSTNPDYDVNLLELDGDLEGSFDVYYAGWNRGESAPSSSVAVHHPADKPLQVAIDADPAVDCEFGNCPNGFGDEYWRIYDYEVGMTQGGSSGGGLYDQDVLLVGVLTGGVGTTCNNFGWDEYFKLSAEWDELAPFLDPDGTGAESVGGWGGCAADFNGDGLTNILDFVAFQVAFQAKSPSADCNEDGVLNVLDFVCFQGVFEEGCG